MPDEPEAPKPPCLGSGQEYLAPPRPTLLTLLGPFALAALLASPALAAPGAGAIADGAHLLDAAGRARVEEAAALAQGSGIGLGLVTVADEASLPGGFDAAARDLPAAWGGRWLLVGVASGPGRVAVVDTRAGPALGWGKEDPGWVLVAGIDALRAGDVAAGFAGIAGKVAGYRQKGDLGAYVTTVVTAALAGLLGLALGRVRGWMARARQRPGLAWAFAFLCLLPVALLLSYAVTQVQEAAGDGRASLVAGGLFAGLVWLCRFSWRGVLAAGLWLFVVSPFLVIPTLSLNQDWAGLPEAAYLQRHLIIAFLGLGPALALWAWRRRRDGLPLLPKEG